MVRLRPFLKWPGGKQHLIAEILRVVPLEYNRYFEPFLGGGALYFSLLPRQAVLSDINRELIDVYVQVRDSVDSLIRCLKRMRYNRKEYYRIRSLRPRGPSQRAARFIYLNRACWNGLYRVNRMGQFNVPFGRFCKPQICDSSKLRRASATLANTRLVACDFEAAADEARRGDLIYFDPPYRTTAEHNGFLKYHSRIFSWGDQVRLAGCFAQLDRKGCYLVLSNAGHPDIRSLYESFPMRTISRRCLIAADRTKRRLVRELLVTNF